MWDDLSCNPTKSQRSHGFRNVPLHTQHRPDLPSAVFHYVILSTSEVGAVSSSWPLHKPTQTALTPLCRSASTYTIKIKTCCKFFCRADLLCTYLLSAPGSQLSSSTLLQFLQPYLHRPSPSVQPTALWGGHIS